MIAWSWVMYACGVFSGCFIWSVGSVIKRDLESAFDRRVDREVNRRDEIRIMQRQHDAYFEAREAAARHASCGDDTTLTPPPA